MRPHTDVRERIGEARWCAIEAAGFVWDGKRFGWFVPGAPLTTFVSFESVQDSGLDDAAFREALDGRVRRWRRRTSSPRIPPLHFSTPATSVRAASNPASTRWLMLAGVLGALAGCSPTVNGPWLSLQTTVQACPSPQATPFGAGAVGAVRASP